MGSAVGLALGLGLANVATTVEAVQVVPNVVTNPDRFLALHQETHSRLRCVDQSLPSLDDPWGRVTFRADFLGSGYAETTPECLDAVRRIAATENLRLDTTYTGKALAALLADADAGKLHGRRVMFWNTYNSRRLPESVETAEVNTIPQSLRHYLE